MVQSRRNKKQKELMGSHQRCWLWGRHAVMEILAAGRWTVMELYLDLEMDEERLEKVRRLADEMGVRCQEVTKERIFQLCHAKEHQGFLAKMTAFPYADLAETLAALPDTPLIAMLDAIQDPFNFGALLRSAEVMGVQAIIVGEREQAEVNRMVARSSSGAVNRIPIIRVPDLVEAAKQVQEATIALVAATEKGTCACNAYDLSQATAIVLGNEGSGIRPELLACCDAQVRIPQSGQIGSLNVAAAAAVLFYEACRQRSGL